MSPATIMVVEDNAITRKMVKVALEAEGYTVLAAGDGASAIETARRTMPDVILQDLLLPDMDGFTLVARLRALPGGDAVPIVAFTGFVSKMEDARISAARFSGLLIKPVEPSRLVATVREHLVRLRLAAAPAAARAHVLLVDDDPTMLKLHRLQLEQMGFDVTTAKDGEQALAKARRDVPDVVLADVLMPKLDGFRLTAAVRADKRLAKVPVVLVTAHFVDDADRRMATRVGAQGMLHRTPNLEGAAELIAEAIRRGVPRVRRARADVAKDAEYIARVIAQLERQATVNLGLTQRASLQAAALVALAAIADALSRHAPIEPAIEQALSQCIDAAGLSRGAVLLRHADGTLSCAAQIGFSGAEGAGLEALLARGRALEPILSQSTPVTVTPSDAISDATSEFLVRTAASSALIAPISSGGERLGALLLTSATRLLTGEDWNAFAQAIASQLGQAIALSRAFSRLEESAERYRTLFDGVPIGLYRTTAAGSVLEANTALVALLGHPSRNSLVGTAIRDLYVEPGDRARLIAQVQRDGVAHGFLTRLRRADGSELQVEIDASARPGPDGRIAFIEGAIVDITERKSLQAQLIQAQKMEAVGQLAGGIAHDFNNLLGAIAVFGELAASDLPSDDPRLPDLAGIQEAVRRATTLTRQLLAFSRKQVLRPKVVDPNGIIRDMLKILARLIGEDIEIITDLDAAAGQVRVDPSQLEQVLLNLAVNARDAMPSGGRLTIRTGRTRLEALQARERELVSAGEYSVISVTDTGEGMSRDVQARIFEPFFSTKGAKGTGLGLATVLGIVRQSSGHIAVDSEPGKGSTFTIMLPRSGEAAEAPDAHADGVETMGGAETILIAEDDPALQLATTTVLTRLGYQVLATSSAEEALACAGSHTGRIHLILSDVVMQGMNGSELVERLRLARPDTRALLMSGYAGDDITRRGIEESGIPFLQKPYSTSELARSVREVLDARGPERT